MVVLGNPPYSVSSTNKSQWIEKLVNDYKKDLNEKNIQPLSDDYIKFIRFGHHFIDKNGSGILAYISNNSFLEGLIHRQMRKFLLESFDKIYILDLHGNSRRKETALDGGKDENVFDIMQGVSINIFVKTGEKKPKELGKIFHFDLHGKREIKYQYLLNIDNTLKNINWNVFTPKAPHYYFIKKDFTGVIDYEKGFKISDFFMVNTTGIKTHRDDLVIDISESNLRERIIKFFNPKYSDNDIAKELDLKDNRDWKLSLARTKDKYQSDCIHLINYRPFDKRYIYYSSNLIDFTKEKVMQNFLSENNDRKNIGLSITRRIEGDRNFADIFVFDKMIQHHSLSIKEVNNLMPLYLYPETNTLLGAEPRTPNLKPEILATIAKGLGLNFTVEKEDDATTFAPIDILDYIYAVLHSPSYRERYKEFLKSDFPRVPYPQDAQEFWALVALGEQLRGLHLLETVSNRQLGGYPIAGDNTVEKIRYEDNKVYINNSQYFDNVPEIAWMFYIGGYQPAQKWLKDRKEQTLSFEDIQHYQRIIVALQQTDELMKKIDNVLII
jgi:predicted helicase